MMRSVLACLLVSSIAVADRAAPQGEAAEPPEGFGGPRLPQPVPPPPRVVIPAPEVMKLGKALEGKYKCKGIRLRDDGSSQPMIASLAVRLDLDNAWVATTFVEDKAAGGIKWSEFRTFDPTAKQWSRVHVANDASYATATSLGEQNGKWSWEGTETSPTGTLLLREHEQHDSKQIKLWGEAMLSGSWQKLYEATCTK